MEEPEPSIKPFIEWLKRDYYILIVVLICVLAMLIGYNQMGSMYQSCNKQWQEHIQLNCYCTNDTFKGIGANAPSDYLVHYGVDLNGS